MSQGNNMQQYIDINTCIHQPCEMFLVSHSVDLCLYFISLADLSSLVSNYALVYCLIVEYHPLNHTMLACHVIMLHRSGLQRLHYRSLGILQCDTALCKFQRSKQRCSYASFTTAIVL